MKRLLALTLLFAFLLCGCQNTSEEAKPIEMEEVPLSESYGMTATIHYNEFEMTALVDKDQPGHYNIELTEPESLAGMMLDITDDQVAITYKGITADFDPDSIAGSAIAKGLIGVLNTVAGEQGISASLQDGTFTLSGENDMGAFTLTLDAESGSLLALEIPSENLSVEFSDFIPR